MMLQTEPDSLAGTSMTPRSGSTAGRRRLFNAGLVLQDGNNQPLPYLAEALPQLNTDSWKVFPDGRMETSYRLRPDLVWHDGAPLTADDFVFSWQVLSTPQYGQSGTEPINMIQEVVAPDPRTVLIRWKGAYAEAGVLEAVVSTGVPTGGPSFAPLPRHVLGRTFEEQPQALPTNPFWTVDFVGAGPFRLDRWETGAFIEAAAFDRHVLGRPKIDRVKLIWNSDSNAILANLLSGEALLVLDGGLGMPEAQVLKREWEARNAGTVQFNPKNWRYIAVQQRPEYANPKAQLDPRVRQALAHTIDKQAINDGLFDGLGLLTDSMMYPTVPYVDELNRAIAKYPLDARRAEALMLEAGYRRGAGGFYESPAEGHLQFQVKSTVSAQNSSERTIMATEWKPSGFDVEDASLTQAESQNGENLATFRGMYVGAAPAGVQGIGLFTSAIIPSPDNRWVGGNRGGFSNPDYDRFAGAVQSTLEPKDRVQVIISAARVITEQVGAISLYFVPWPVVFPAAVKGMNLRAADADQTWNIYMWEL
jgi:peptide/nickel transport system substrate-binding protein